MSLDDDELKEEYTLDDRGHDVESDDGAGDVYIKNESDTA